MRTPFVVLSRAVALAALPSAAFAHDGHLHDGLAAGLAHPLGGADHLLATVGIGAVVGLAALRATARSRVDAPAGPTLARGALAAALGLLAGVVALLAGAGASLPGGALEQAAAAGLIALAVALVAGDRLGPRGLSMLALAVLLPHGALHASEGAGVGFFVGMVLASAALFATGALAGRAIGALRRERATVLRWIAAAGYVGAFAWLTTGAR